MKKTQTSSKKVKVEEEKAILRKTVVGEDGKTYEIEEELKIPDFPDDVNL